MVARWLAPASGAMARLADAMARRQAHPSRTLVLLPYAQLMPLARQMWARWVAQSASGPGGAAAFVPRFETTTNWAAGLVATLPAGDDITFETARDLLTAQTLLERAGMAAQRELLAARLVEAAYPLAALAAAVLPGERATWVARNRPVVAAGLDASAMVLEQVLARLALEWAAASAYATDALLVDGATDGWDCVVVLQGFRMEPVVETLLRLLGEKAELLPLDEPAPAGAIFLHATRDGEDEAERAAACVLRHVMAKHLPVALADIDRALTRRIRAKLAAHAVAIRDENGWKLSTTRAAAQLMGVLRAAAWNAGSDAVIDWLKNAPAFDAVAVQAIEKAVRRAGVREWRRWSQRFAADDTTAVAAMVAQANVLRGQLQAARPLVQWLAALREALVQGGQWAPLAADAAGARLLLELHLGEASQLDFAEALADTAFATRRLGLAEWTAWVDAVLEAASFKPDYPAQEQVVILPMSQLLGRPFAALVLPGCDEQRLSPSPEPPGNWSTAQRRALGLPVREDLALAQRAAWRNALQTPHCDVLWRGGDDSGEPLLPSLLVQELLLEQGRPAGNTRWADDPRGVRSVAPQPGLPPQPVGNALPLATLSASAYEDLRRCPYRFFALRQLGLREADEIDGELDKRDFGLWLHAVLRAFHEALAAHPTGDAGERHRMADTAAEEATRTMGLQDGEFLPFAAAWPRVRDGYLAWLVDHEAEGHRFAAAEIERAVPLGAVTLAGRLDRIDRDAAGNYVLDYKTEAQGATRERLKQPLEDTQLAFYAALLPDDSLRAAYVNVGEKDGTKTFEQPDIVAVRDALMEGIQHDMAEIGAGAALPALGEGTVCDFCAAKGLCRKDWWIN